MFIDLAESQSFTKQKVDKTKQFGDDSPGINHHSSDVAVIIIHPNKCNVPADVHTHTKTRKTRGFPFGKLPTNGRWPTSFCMLTGYHIHLYMCGWLFVVFFKQFMVDVSVTTMCTNGVS